MLRNRSLQNMPEWAQQVVSQLLKPPPFLMPDKPSPVSGSTSMPGTASQRSSGFASSSGKRTDPGSPPRHTRTVAAPLPAEGLNDIPIESERRWHAALVRTDIPEPALYAYGWDILDVTRHQNIVRIATDDGDFALKHTHVSAKRVKFIDKAMEHAKSQGFHRFAQIIRTNGGRPYYLHDAGVYYATRWVPGTEANFASLPQVGHVARALAEWHEASRGFRPEGFQPDSEFAMRQMLQRRFDDLRVLLAETESKVAPDAFDATLLTMSSSLRKDAQRSVQLMESTDIANFLKKDMKRPGLCHLDVIPGNFVYDKEKQMHLLDLDLSTYAPRALDLAHLLRRSLERANWNTEVAYTTFLNYHEVAALEPSEYGIVQALLTFPYRVWRLAHTRHRVLADESQVAELKNAAAEEMRRRAFLESYARQIQSIE